MWLGTGPRPAAARGRRDRDAHPGGNADIDAHPDTCADPATSTPAPPLSTTTAAPPPPNLCGAPSNPWGFNFCSGNFITSPPSSFCSYFACIANFPNGRGYVIQCQDGMFSKSGGIQGSCSYHHGNLRPLFSP